MTLIDFAPVINALIAALALVITGLIGIYVPRAIAAFERRTGVAVTEQERSAVMQAVTTAAGLLQAQLNTGMLKPADITPRNPVVEDVARAALQRVPDSAAAQGTTVAAAATMIAARVDTTPPPVIVVPVAAKGGSK